MFPKSILILMAALSAGSCSGFSGPEEGKPEGSSDQWVIEKQSPDVVVTFAGEIIDVDTPEGITLWYKEPLEIPLRIDFEVLAVADGGPNDHISDINAFWMATNADGSSVLDRPRSGTFGEYDTMRGYYVGIGGNRNSTTRMRRYVGEAGNRPILPEHDLSEPEHMIEPNTWIQISLLAEKEFFAVERDGKRIFTYALAEPYTRGHFGLRTTKSHLRYRNIRIGKHDED